MNKIELINDITVGIASVLGESTIDVVKAILTVKLNDYNLVEATQLPSTEVFDNYKVIDRFKIDMLAKGLKPSTIKGYVHTIKRFFTIVNVTYADVTGEVVTNYLARLRVVKNNKGEYNTQATIANNYKQLKVFFDWLYKRHHIDNNPMRDVDAIATPRSKKDRLTDEEVERIRELDLSARERALFELMVSTGLRVGEIRNLTLADINLSDRSVTVREGKTENARRTIFFSIKARNALSRYIGQRTSGYLFTTIRGQIRDNVRIALNTLEAIAIDLGRKANCHIKTTVHAFRKTFASRAFEQTGDMKFVSLCLGHASTAVTEKTYVVDNMNNFKNMALRIA